MMQGAQAQPKASSTAVPILQQREERETPAIEVSRLSKTYKGNVCALREISFSVSRGSIFGILGPNGAGKSTLVRILTTLSLPSTGSATLAGFNVVSSAQEVRRLIGYVPQGSGLDPLATGRENLVLQGNIYGFRGNELNRRIGALLELFALAELADRRVYMYSGGMKRRLELALALVHGPELLFLDEPTAGLDPESRSGLWSHIKRLVVESHRTIILTTHDMAEADILADRLMILDRGTIVCAGTPQELKGRLRGDFIEISPVLPEQAGQGKAILEKLSEVLHVIHDGAILYAEVKDAGSAIPGILKALTEAGVPVKQVAFNRPSLEDVYLTATGHKYRVGAPSFRASFW